MEIRTKNKIVRKKVGDLDMMNAYLIFDSETNDNNLIITDTDHNAIILSKHSNDSDVCILRLTKDNEVNVIGKINDFDIINVNFRGLD